MSPFPKVVRSPQDIGKKSVEKALGAHSNESTSTGDSELLRTYITRISNQTPPKHLRSQDGAVATTSHATSIEGFCPEDRQATHQDRCNLRTITPSPIRQTRSRSKSGDAAVDDDGLNAPLKRKPSKLITILTSEHDYSQSSAHELKGDTVLPLSLEENISARNIDLQRTVLIQESGIVGGSEPGTSNTKISNTDSASLRIITSQESSNITSLSSTSAQDEDKNLGFDLNDFVIRRRRLRSESQQDELWEGLPSVTPFRKHPSKLKDENESKYDTNTGDDVPDVNNPSSEPASSSNESLQERTSSSTIGLISEIDSILTDTESSSCQGHVSFEEVPSLEEGTPVCSTCGTSEGEAGASEEEAGASSLQRVLDYDLEAAANNSLSELDTNVKSIFSSDISSCASTFISREFTSPNEQQYSTEGSFSMKPGSRSSGQLTFCSDPGTPMPSGPESVWWSDKANSEGWATPVADPLAISPLATNSNSSDLGTLHTESEQGLESCRIPKDEYDSLSNSCDAVDGRVFKEVMERKGTDGQLDISAEVKNSNLTTLTDDIQSVTSSDTNTSVSLTEDSDQQKSPVRFMVTRSDCANIDSDTAKETGEQVMQPTSSEASKPKSSSSSSGEFLLWSKKKDKRKISFPKIVLRKCKESSLRAKERHSPQPKDDGGERPQSMTETDESTATSESPASGSTSLTPIKRSARLMKKVDSSASGQCGRSNDFVYTPLKRDDNKTKTRTSTESPSPSRRRRSSSDNCQGEEDAGAGPSTDRNISDIDVTVLSPRQLRMLEREGREVVQTDSNHGLPLKARWKKKVKRNLKNTQGALKKSSGTTLDQRERPELQQIPSCLPPRRKKGPNIDEELLANPVLDKHACVLWSSEHRRHFQMSHPDASSAALDELLRRQWSQELTPQEKMKYFIRARDAVRDEDKHQPRISRGETKRVGRSGSSQKSTEEEDEQSSLEQFTRLKTKRQKDLLTKWLHFFQKVLSRQDYAKFIEDVKEGILEAEAQNKPNKTRGLTSKIFSHKKLLFVKMNSLKGHVMAQYHRRKRRLKDLQKLAFYILVTRLIQGKPCSFIKGCRSKRLTGVLQDLKDLEYGDSIAVLGYPIPTNSFTNLYKEIVETVDSCMFREETPDATDLGNPETVPEDGTSNGRDEADANKETTTNSVVSKICVDKKNTVSLLQKHPVVQEPEWFEKPVSEQFMNRTVNELKSVTIFPQLHPRTLDSVFLPPPFRMPVCGAPSVGRSLLQRAPGQIQYRCVATPWMSGCRPSVSTTPRVHSGHQSVREVLYADARDAFQRSYASNTDPCCEMDSPSCVLSTWLVADKVRK
ncbi:uncharacterized protein LOC124287886 [Haliotis rubra]|uniref:uncharacterized protein LOC124287886 n=1 Tax=Haliotis rubra TaxID=36100 RepID=UPI001EE51937|nr:uncharacterized protein LOC124287886 [Haliotis rubra]